MRILIADDHPVVRQGVRQIIESEPGFSVAAEATNGEEALSLAREVQWDLAVLDYAMPGRCGLELIGDFRREFPGRSILVLSMHEEDVHAAAVLAAGGSGWVSKESAPKELATAIKRVAAGGRYVSEGLAEALAAGPAARTPTPTTTAERATPGTSRGRTCRTRRSSSKP